MSEHSHLWNDLPFYERSRLMPYQIETHILHLEQTKAVIIHNHRRTIDEIEAHIGNLKRSLIEAERPALKAGDSG